MVDELAARRRVRHMHDLCIQAKRTERILEGEDGDDGCDWSVMYGLAVLRLMFAELRAQARECKPTITVLFGKAPT